jgi:hypothetical protein
VGDRFLARAGARQEAVEAADLDGFEMAIKPS